MAIKELFQDNRPEVLFDPRAARRIDPRFKFTRNSAASFVDKDGVLQVNGAPAGQPRYNYDPVTKEFLGLLVEPAKTNLLQRSEELENATWAKNNVSVTENTTTSPDGTVNADKVIENTATAEHGISQSFTAVAGTTYTASVYAKSAGANRVLTLRYTLASWSGAVNNQVWFNLTTGVGTRLTGTPTFASESVGNGWWRFSITSTSTANAVPGFALQLSVDGTNINYQGDGVSGVFLWGAQVETVSKTSYIRTTSSSSTRAADVISYAAPLPSTGSIFVDSRAVSSANGDVLVSVANASNNKINLGYESRSETFNSLALLANYNGTVKAALPLLVPSTQRERNILTWGANNYQYGSTFSRFAASLSSSVPSSLNRLAIGHDVVDPTKAFIGHINKVYLWSGEIVPSVAEGLVRGELDPINADTFDPTGPAGALSLIINTQGAGSDAEKTFTLPANRAAAYAATALVAGQVYRINSVGTTNFTLIGAAANTVGTVFTATGPGTGTGTAIWQNDVVITWGDNTESGLEGTAAEVGAVGLTHTYPSAGIYAVFAEGRIQNIFYNNIANAPDLVRIEAWGTGDMFTAPTTMNGAFYGCSKLDFSATARTTNIPNTTAVTDWANAFRGCASITGTFPQLNYSSATTLFASFLGCSSITQWPNVGNQTQNVTELSFAFLGCSSLTSFPLINTSKVTGFSNAWASCSSLTSFPLINTSLGTVFLGTWGGCVGLTSFPLLNTEAGVNFQGAWSGCTGLTSFPLLNTSSGTNFFSTWQGCTSLTSFPAINTAAGTSFAFAWQNCAALASFPSLTFDASVTGSSADSPAVYTGFYGTWKDCVALTTFPANLFNNVTNCNRYLDAFRRCALTAASIENIIVSIEAAGTSNGNLSFQDGTNAGASTWTAPAIAAYNALVARGWTITRNA